MAEDDQKMTWQPIREAPKNGSRILLHDGDALSLHSAYVGYFGFVPQGRPGNPNYYGTERKAWLSEPGRYEKSPRYWMPLPKAPSR